MQNHDNQPNTTKENIIDSVVLDLQYNEFVCTEKQTLDTAESHFYDYMYPTIRDTVETYQSHQINVEKIEIDLGDIELRDIPQKLEMMLKEALEKHISEDEERTGVEQEIAVIKEDSNHHMIDFLCQEQLPWTEESELFEPETWWNENLQKLLSTPSDLHSLYKHCQSGAASLYRLLTYSNKSGLTRLLTKWIIDDDIIPSQLKEILNEAGLTTEHAISLKVKELTKTQIGLLLIAILSVKENCASISLENATNVLTGITQNTFDHALTFSEEDLRKELLKQAYSEVESNTCQSDKTFPAETDIRNALTQHDYPGKEDVLADNNGGRTTHLHDKDTREYNRDIEGSTRIFPEKNPMKELLNQAYSEVESNTCQSDNASTAETDIRNALTQHDYPGKGDVMADNNGGRTTHLHDKDTREYNRDIEGSTRIFPEKNPMKELLNQAYSEVESNTCQSDNASTAETDIRNALTQHDYPGKGDVMADNNGGRTTHLHDKDTREHNRDIEGNSSEIPQEGIKTDEQIKMLLNALLSDMHPNSASNDYDTEDNKRYSTDVAGIVLLHPFLANYFRQVRLLDENDQFVSLEKQIHAVHLLRYLTGKKGRHHSHLLNAEKIICGLPPTFPIPIKHSISEMEKKEAQDMFDAVKQYWKSISKTSIEGIQTSFIHRHGIITYEKPYWLIRVEGSTLDILMDDLPWEMSMLIFPWIDKNILIEWQSAI